MTRWSKALLALIILNELRGAAVVAAFLWGGDVMTQPTDFIEQLAAINEKPGPKGLVFELGTVTLANIDAILALGRLREAALGLQTDLLDRAEWCPDAGKVVCAGNGAWFRFCQALEGLKKAGLHDV